MSSEYQWLMVASAPRAEDKLDLPRKSKLYNATNPLSPMRAASTKGEFQEKATKGAKDFQRPEVLCKHKPTFPWIVDVGECDPHLCGAEEWHVLIPIVLPKPH